MLLSDWFPAAPPSDPRITGQERLRLGAGSGLTCRVSGVYPPELLTLSWIRGDQVLQSIMGDPGSSWVQSEFRFIPQDQDSGESISCRAHLDLKDLPPQDQTRETRITLNPLCKSCTVLGLVLKGGGSCVKYLSSGSWFWFSCRSSRGLSGPGLGSGFVRVSSLSELFSKGEPRARTHLDLQDSRGGV